MVCPSCREGGQFNAAANTQTGPVAESLVKEATKAHKKCLNNTVRSDIPDGTHSERSRTWCDCQCATGVYLNPSIVDTEKRNTGDG